MNESLLLAQNVEQTCYDDIPADVVETTKRSLLDALGVTLAAGTLGEGCRAVVDLAIAEGGKKESSIVGFAQRVTASQAAFANGAMAHALDFEDAHEAALVHPHAAVIPAALAIAESIGHVSGDEFLTAVVLGSDLTCRLGLALDRDLLAYGWYMPPILGAFGATAAVCKLWHLKAEQIVDAFSLALCQATCSAELAHSKHSLIRSIRDAFSAQAGVRSAAMAQRGITGFEHPFEGRAGLYSAYARGEFDPSKLTYELGRTFEGRDVSFKPYPSCRGTHPYVDAALEMRQAHALRPETINAIKVIVSPINRMLCEPLDVRRKPNSAIDAKFSIPFVIATALVHGSVTLNHFAPRALADQAVLDLAQKVTYQVNNELTRRQAAQGELHVHTGTGTISCAVDVAYGHPTKPMSDSALISKFRNCASYAATAVSPKDLDRIVERVLELDKLSDISKLTEYL